MNPEPLARPYTLYMVFLFLELGEEYWMYGSMASKLPCCKKGPFSTLSSFTKSVDL